MRIWAVVSVVLLLMVTSLTGEAADESVFTLEANASTVTTTQGSWAVLAVHGVLRQASPVNVTLGASSLPSGVTVQYADSLLRFERIGGHPPYTSIVGAYIRTSRSTPAGTYNILLTGTGGSVTRTLPITLVVQTLSASAIHVSLSGDDSTGNGTSGNPYRTIQHGLNNAGAGRTVFVQAGTYHENISFPTSGTSGSRIMLVGESGAVIDGNHRITGWEPTGTNGVYRKLKSQLPWSVPKAASYNGKYTVFMQENSSYSSSLWSQRGDVVWDDVDGRSDKDRWDVWGALGIVDGTYAYVHIGATDEDPDDADYTIGGEPTITIDSRQYITIRGFTIQNGDGQISIHGSTGNLIVEHSVLKGAMQQIDTWGCPGPFTFQNLELTQNFYYDDCGHPLGQSDISYDGCLVPFRHDMSYEFPDMQIRMQTNANVVIRNSYLHHMLGGTDITERSSGTYEIAENYFARCTDYCIYGWNMTGGTLIIRDNLFIEGDAMMRLDNEYSGFTSYVYRNRFHGLTYNLQGWYSSGYKAMNVNGGEATRYIYHNSYSGPSGVTWGDYDNWGGSGGPNTYFMNNILATNDNCAYNCGSMLSSVHDDYNWNSGNNLHWDAYNPTFSLQAGDSWAIDQGIDLSTGWSLDGGSGGQLHGMSSGYYTGSDPDLGAREYAASAPSSATYYVRTNGTATTCVANTDTIAGARNSLQAGLNCLQGPGDTLVVHGGTYGTGTGSVTTPEGISGVEGNPITVRAAPGETVWFRGTFNNWNASGGAWYVFDGININASLRPCTDVSGNCRTSAFLVGQSGVLQNAEIYGAPYYGVGLGSDTTVFNVRSHDHGNGANSACLGYPATLGGQCHGFYSSDQRVTILNSEAYNNQGQGFVSNGYDHVVANTKLHHNVDGILLYGGPTGSLIYNNLIYRNTGSGVMVPAGNFLYHNTVAFNGNALYPDHQSATYRNNIFYNNGAGTYATPAGSNSLCWPANVTGCAVFGNPLFQSEPGDDYRLQPASPAINQGVTVAAVTTDIEGNARPYPVGGAPDIGAYEADSVNQPQPNFSFSATTPVPYNGASTLSWAVTQADSCVAEMVSGIDTNWTGTTSAALLAGGTKQSQPMTANKTFRMTCTLNGVPASVDRLVAVAPPDPDPEGLHAWWTCDAGAGTVLADSETTVYNNVGTFSSAGWSTDAAVGSNSCSFNGARYVTVNEVGGLSHAQYFTISAWIKATSTDTEGGEIFSRGDSYAMYVLPNGDIQVFYYDGTWWVMLTSSGVNVLNGQWRHVVGMKDPYGLRIWVDKVQIASMATTGLISYTLGATAELGRHGMGMTTRDFIGLIDQYRVYNTYTNQQGVDNLFNERVPEGDLSQVGMAWEAPNTTTPQTVNELIGVNVNRSQLLTSPAGVRVVVTNNTGFERTDHFALTVCNVADCDADSDWKEVTNVFNTVGVRLGSDSHVNMGDSTTLLLPTGGLTPVAGRYVADTINKAMKTTLPHGAVTEWVYRPLEFGAPLTAGSQVKFRVVDDSMTPLDNYTNIVTLSLTSPTLHSLRLGITHVGGSIR